MPAARTVIDLDSQFAPRLAEQAENAEYVKVKLFSQEWRVTTAQNVYSALAGGTGDVEAILNLIQNIVHPDERSDFRKALMAQEGMDAPTMLDILNALTEVAAERPTKSRSVSSTGRTTVSPKRRTSAAK